MRTCPSCGYDNGDAAAKCGICGGDLSAVPRGRRPADGAKKEDGRNWGLVILGLAAIASGFYLGLKGAPPPRPRAAEPADRFSNAGVVLTLEKMAQLVLPGPAERAAVVKAFDDPDWKVREAAVGAAGAWLRGGAYGAAPLREKLFSALDDRAPAVKKEAGMETGLLLGLGKLGRAEVPRLEGRVLSLMEDGDDGVKSAGYFVAAMAGLAGLRGRLEQAARREPVRMTRLYASCALAGFGSADGAAAVFKAAADPDPAVRKEAALCLSYTADPAAVRLLKKLSGRDPDKEVSDNARFSLKLREQLAIINTAPG